MTRQEFLELQTTIVCDMTRAVERERDRIRAVTYEQAMQNEKNDIPLFGWHPDAPQKIRDERVADWHKFRQSKKYISDEDELQSAISIAIAVYKARVGFADAREEAVVDEAILNLLDKYIDDYPQFDRPEKTN